MLNGRYNDYCNVIHVQLLAYTVSLATCDIITFIEIIKAMSFRGLYRL